MKFIKDIISRKRNAPVDEELSEELDWVEPVEVKDTSGEDMLSNLASIQSRLQEASGAADVVKKKARINSAQVESFEDILAERAKSTADEKNQTKPADNTVARPISENTGLDDLEPIAEGQAATNAELRKMHRISEALETKAKPTTREPKDERKPSGPSAGKLAMVASAEQADVLSEPSTGVTSKLDNALKTPITKVVKEPTAETDSVVAVSKDKPAPGPRIVEVPAPSAGRAGRRAGRVKTRLLGFEHGQDASNDPFEATNKATGQGQAEFPVGWIVVISGPGRGASFTLFNGVSQIGRGEDQAIKLDFGDSSISRNNHAAIAYDGEQRAFFLGHGGKANLVRLNDKPVLSTEEISNSDLIRIGETTLRFVGLCGSDFDWEVDNQEDIIDAAIA